MSERAIAILAWGVVISLLAGGYAGIAFKLMELPFVR